MSKITIISGIIAAVCIFQTAEAGLFDRSLGGSLLGNARKEISGTLGNVKDLGDKIKNQGKEAIDDLKNGLETSQKELRNNTACTKIYNDGQEVISEIISLLSTCIANETQSASADVNKLNDAINDLKANATKLYQDALNCVQNLANLATCIPNVLQDISTLEPLIENTVKAAYKLIGFFPNVGVCYQNAILKSVNQNGSKLFKDVEECIKTVIPFPF